MLFAVGALAGCSHGATAATAQASAAAVSANNPGSSSDGATVYLTNCSSCHGADGRGTAGMDPPLAHDATVTGDPRRVIEIVENGSHVHGDMPAWKGQIPDDQIASVITYIRSAWGNRARGITMAEVRSER